MSQFTVFAADRQSNYTVLGTDMQVLNIDMAPGDKVISTPGSMNYMQSGFNSSVDFSCSTCIGRCCAGESCCMMVFTNSGSGNAAIGLTPSFPAKVIPVPMSSYPDVLLKTGSYMSHLGNVELGYDTDCCTLTCCCGGQGCCRARIKGTDGVTFLNAGGTILQRTLQAGEVLKVDTNSVVGWESSVTFGIKSNGGCTNCCCAGEGLFSTTLTGPGTVWLQSQSIEKLRLGIAKQAAKQGGNKNGGGGGGPADVSMSR